MCKASARRGTILCVGRRFACAGLDEVYLSRRPDRVEFLAEHRAWLVALNMARIAVDRTAGQIGALSNEIPKGLAPARETMLGFFRGGERKFDSDPRATILSPLLGKSEGSSRWSQKREFHVIADAGTNTLHNLGQDRCDCNQRGLAETGKKQVTVMERLSGRVNSQSPNMTCSGTIRDLIA